MSVSQMLQNRPGLWFGMVGAPFAWVVHFILMWAITEMGCRLGVADTRIFGIYAAHLLVVVSTGVTLAIIAAAAYTSYRNWQRIRAGNTDEPDNAADSSGRTQFMGMLGMLFSALFAVTVIYMLIPVFALPLCDAVR